jgi:predicted component of type VI protein secretion system
MDFNKQKLKVLLVTTYAHDDQRVTMENDQVKVELTLKDQNDFLPLHFREEVDLFREQEVADLRAEIASLNSTVSTLNAEIERLKAGSTSQ